MAGGPGATRGVGCFAGADEPADRNRQRRIDAKSGRMDLVAIEAVVAGDQIRVLPGEVVPVDGQIVEGRSEFDEALLSGESVPVSAPGGRDSDHRAR